MTEDGNKFDMTRVNEMKDIGVIVDSELKFDRHINSRIETANKATSPREKAELLNKQFSSVFTEEATDVLPQMSTISTLA